MVARCQTWSLGSDCGVCIGGGCAAKVVCGGSRKGKGAGGAVVVACGCAPEGWELCRATSPPSLGLFGDLGCEFIHTESAEGCGNC
eukprot:4704104-Amphidinium_carterae.1